MASSEIESSSSIRPSSWQATVSQLHQLSAHWVLSMTGGGASAIGRLLEIPGGSRTLLEAIVPYSPASVADWLGRVPEQFCSQATALAMAVVSQRRARQLTEPRRGTSSSGQTAIVQLAGLGCTASLASDKPKRGEHRCHIALHTENATSWLAIRLAKNRRTRADEERLVADLVLGLLAAEFEITSPAPAGLLPEDRIERRRAVCTPLQSGLFRGEVPFVWRQPTGDFSLDPAQPVAGLLPGSFNPLHEGHRQLRNAAERRLGCRVAWEIAVTNVDKPPLDHLTLHDRCQQFHDAPVALTSAPTFLAKSEILPNKVFVIGADTAQRVIDPKYYAGDLDQMRQALKTIRTNGCRFLVAGRVRDGEFETFQELRIPAEFADLFEELPEKEFRCDVSSTELRSKTGDG